MTAIYDAALFKSVCLQMSSKYLQTTSLYRVIAGRLQVRGSRALLL